MFYTNVSKRVQVHYEHIIHIMYVIEASRYLEIHV